MKQARAAGRRHERNRSARSEVKTDITQAEKLIFTGDLEGARKAVAAAMSALDKAAEKKILHGNNAARRKARLMKKLNQAVAKPAAAPAPDKTA
jgi:small subunit ribosomal protein S20